MDAAHNTYVYLGDLLTDPDLISATPQAVRDNRSKCIQGGMALCWFVFKMGAWPQWSPAASKQCVPNLNQRYMPLD